MQQTMFATVHKRPCRQDLGFWSYEWSLGNWGVNREHIFVCAHLCLLVGDTLMGLSRAAGKSVLNRYSGALEVYLDTGRLY